MNNSVNMQRQPQTQQIKPMMSTPSAPPMGMGQAQPFNSLPQQRMQQPGMPMQQPGMPMQQPGMMQQPINQQGMMPNNFGMQQPGMQQGGMPMQQPGMMQQGGMPMQQGGMPMQQPGMMQQGGMPMQQQPGMQQPYGQQPMQQMYGNPQMGQFGFQPPAGGMVGSVSLAKGGNTSLSKIAPNLTCARIGLGWDVRQTGGPAFDLDASCFLLKADGRVRMPQDLIFYNNKQSVDGSVFHHGDNLTGAGDGDDEMVTVDLNRVPMDVQKIVFTCSIYEAEMRQQNFGMVSRAFIRVCDGTTNQEICRYDLSEEASLFNTMIFGEVYRYNNEWKFRAVGQGIQGGLRALGGMFGLNLQ